MNLLLWPQSNCQQGKYNLLIELNLLPQFSIQKSSNFVQDAWGCKLVLKVCGAFSFF